MIHTVSAAILLLAMFLQTPVTSAQSRTSQPQRGQRAATAKAQPPMTLRQVIESLVTLKNSKRVEDLISKSGVDFQATPAVLDRERDYPRRLLTQYAQRHPNGDAVAVTTIWQLEKHELDAIAATVGEGGADFGHRHHIAGLRP